MRIDERFVNGVVVLDLRGKLTAAERSGFRERIARLGRMGERSFVLNLERLSVVDASGLATMLEMLSSVRRRGGLVTLEHLRVHELLVAAKLLTEFDVFDSELAAVRGARQIRDVAA
jgi:anti-anti-sigma factor